MKYFYFLFFSTIVLGVAGCRSGGCVNGSGNQVSQTRDIDEFSSIQVSGSVKLVVKQGAVQQLRIIADDNIQDGIHAKVRNNELVINLEDDFCKTGPITIYATSTNLEGIDASGVVEVLSEGQINADSFDLDLSGASKAMLDISCGNLNTETSGASKVVLKGQAGGHNLKMSGSSELDAFDFVVGKYDISTSGSSELKIDVLNVLNIKSSGSSQITYRGNPQRVTNDKSGASSIKKVN